MSLGQIKAKLSEYAKTGKSVLLHGKCTIDYKKLVLDIHKANGGRGETLEIMGEEPRDEQGIDDMLRTAWKDKDIKRVEEFVLNCKNTSRTYKYYDLDCMLAKDVFDTLLAHKFYKSDYMKKLMSSIYWGWKDLNREIDLEPPIVSDKRIGYTLASPIFRKGLLLLDNLYCRKDSSDDFESYRAFADIIKIRETKGKFEPHLQYSYLLGNTFLFDDGMMKDWLVVYTQTPTVFPDYFVKKFEQICLEGKNIHVEDGVVGQVYEKEIQKIIPFTQKDINWKKVKWEDIKMVIREKTREIDISVGDKKPLNYQYSQMGFKYQEKNEPTKAWLIFLCLARTENNTLNYKIIKGATKYMKLQAFQDRISEIRNNIKCVFPKLTGDPIPHTGKIGYNPLFRICIIADSTSSNEVDPDGYNYQSETIVEEKDV